MSEKKFTPGPWVSHPRTILYGGQSADDGYVINAISGNRDDWYGLAEVVTETEDGDRDSEGVANARLIAAAPDLYDALEASLGLVACWADAYRLRNGEAENHPDHDVLIEQVKAALAKARGEA